MNTSQKRVFIGMMTIASFTVPAFAVAMVEDIRKASDAVATQNQVNDLSDQIAEHRSALESLQLQYDSSLKKQTDAYNKALDETKQQYEKIIADQEKRLQDASMGSVTAASLPKTVTIPSISAQSTVVVPVAEKPVVKKSKPKSSSKSKSS
jgi:flagellar motility protein MotE (MotC chaperone)